MLPPLVLLLLTVPIEAVVSRYRNASVYGSIAGPPSEALVGPRTLTTPLRYCCFCQGALMPCSSCSDPSVSLVEQARLRWNSQMATCAPRGQYEAVATAGTAVPFDCDVTFDFDQKACLIGKRFQPLASDPTRTSNPVVSVGACNTELEMLQVMAGRAGLAPEEWRSDSDTYVDVTPAYLPGFEPKEGPAIGGYDYLSIMQRRPLQDSQDGRLAIVSPVRPLYPPALSPTDVSILRALFVCPDVAGAPPPTPAQGTCFVSLPPPQDPSAAMVYVPPSMRISVVNVLPQSARSVGDTSHTCSVPPLATSSEAFSGTHWRGCVITYTNLPEGTEVQDVIGDLGLGAVGLGPCRATPQKYSFRVHSRGLCPHSVATATTGVSAPCGGDENGECGVTSWESAPLSAPDNEMWRYREGRWPFPCRCRSGRRGHDCGGSVACLPYTAMFGAVSTVASSGTTTSAGPITSSTAPLFGVSGITTGAAPPPTPATSAGGVSSVSLASDPSAPWQLTDRVLKVSCGSTPCTHPVWSAASSVNGHHPMRVSWSFMVGHDDVGVSNSGGCSATQTCAVLEMLVLGNAGTSTQKPIAMLVGVYTQLGSGGSGVNGLQYSVVANGVPIRQGISGKRWWRMTVDFNWVTRSAAVHLSTSATTATEAVNGGRLPFFDRRFDSSVSLDQVPLGAIGSGGAGTISVGDVPFGPIHKDQSSALDGLVGAVVRGRYGYIALFQVICQPAVWPAPSLPGSSSVVPVPVDLSVPFIPVPSAQTVPSSSLRDGLFYEVNGPRVVVSGGVFTLTLYSTTPLTTTSQDAIRFVPAGAACEDALDETQSTVPFLVSSGSATAPTQWWNGVAGYERGAWGPPVAVPRGSLAAHGEVGFATPARPISGIDSPYGSPLVSAASATLRITLPAAAFASVANGAGAGSGSSGLMRGGSLPIGVCYRTGGVQRFTAVQPVVPASGGLRVHAVGWWPHLPRGAPQHLGEKLASFKTDVQSALAYGSGSPAGAPRAAANSPNSATAPGAAAAPGLRQVTLPHVVDRDRILVKLEGLSASDADEIVRSSVAASVHSAAQSTASSAVPPADEQVLYLSRSLSCSDRVPARVCRCVAGVGSCCSYPPTASGVVALVPSLCEASAGGAGGGGGALTSCPLEGDVYVCLGRTPLPLLQGSPAASTVGGAQPVYADWETPLRVRSLSWDGRAGSTGSVIAQPYSAAPSSIWGQSPTTAPSGGGVAGLGVAGSAAATARGPDGVKVPSMTPISLRVNIESSGLSRLTEVWELFVGALRVSEQGTCGGVTPGRVTSGYAAWDGRRAARLVPEVVPLDARASAAAAVVCLSTSQPLVSGVAAGGGGVGAGSAVLSAGSVVPDAWWLPLTVAGSAEQVFSVGPPLTAQLPGGVALIPGLNAAMRGDPGEGGIGVVRVGAGSGAVNSRVAVAVTRGECAQYRAPTAPSTTQRFGAWGTVQSLDARDTSVGPSGPASTPSTGGGLTAWDGSALTTDVTHFVEARVALPTGPSAASAGDMSVCVTTPYAADEYVETWPGVNLTVHASPTYRVLFPPSGRAVRGHGVVLSVGAPQPFPDGAYELILSPSPLCERVDLAEFTDGSAVWSGGSSAVVFTLVPPAEGLWQLCVSTDNGNSFQRMCADGEQPPCHQGIQVRASGVADNFTATSRFISNLTLNPPRKAGLNPLFADVAGRVEMTGYGLQPSDVVTLHGPVASCPTATLTADPIARPCAYTVAASQPLQWLSGTPTSAIYATPAVSLPGVYVLCYTPTANGTANFGATPGPEPFASMYVRSVSVERSAVARSACETVQPSANILIEDIERPAVPALWGPQFNTPLTNWLSDPSTDPARWDKFGMTGSVVTTIAVLGAVLALAVVLVTAIGCMAKRPSPPPGPMLTDHQRFRFDSIPFTDEPMFDPPMMQTPYGALSSPLKHLPSNHNSLAPPLLL